MRSAVVEAETREEVMREMEERMRMMEQKYSKRLMSEMERNEMKTDAKIDMLHQAGLFSSPMKVQTAGQTYSSEEDEEDVEMSLVSTKTLMWRMSTDLVGRWITALRRAIAMKRWTS